MAWRNLPIDSPLFANLDAEVMPNGCSALENLFITEAKGHAAVGNLTEWVTLPDRGTVFLRWWRKREELVAATSHGRVYVIDRGGTVTDRTGTPLGVATRPTFEETEDELLLAGGGPILRLAGKETEVLSQDAPMATHIGYVAGYVLAAEPGSGRVYYSNPGFVRTWDPLNVFAAEDRPDAVTALKVSQSSQVFCAGPDSIEVFRVAPSGTAPFYRYSSLGQGLHSPYTLAEVGSEMWAINSRRELMQLTGPRSSQSDAIARVLERASDWHGSWTEELIFQGHHFLVLQIPLAADDAYGSEGLTFLYDRKGQRWSSLWAWDDAEQRPALWPGRSIAATHAGVFVGGDGGVIYRMSTDTAPGVTQRNLWRSAEIDANNLGMPTGGACIENVRLRLRRPIPGGSAPLRLRFRAAVDGGAWQAWSERTIEPIGSTPSHWLEFGQVGGGQTFRFEYESWGGAPFNVVSAQADVTA